MHTKHTPGPWASSGVGIVQVETGELICNCLFATGESYPNADSNCTLISAAPDMLRALEGILAWMKASNLTHTPSVGTEPFVTEPVQFSVVTQIEQAIRKAKGE